MPHQFGVLKNGVAASVGARGPARNAPEESVGFPLFPEDKSSFPPEEAGGYLPRPVHEEISAL